MNILQELQDIVNRAGDATHSLRDTIKRGITTVIEKNEEDFIIDFAPWSPYDELENEKFQIDSEGLVKSNNNSTELSEFCTDDLLFIFENLIVYTNEKNNN